MARRGSHTEYNKCIVLRQRFYGGRFSRHDSKLRYELSRMNDNIIDKNGYRNTQRYSNFTGNEIPSSRNDIFFHETSCSNEEGIVLNARQACAVESAAKHHPNRGVNLFFINPGKVANASIKLVQQLLSYPNVKIRRIKPMNYVKGTPLEEWYMGGNFKTSRWPNSHMSDILRYLTLWKFPGIYLDLDIVVLK